jgi:probable rRNA maturation factor
VAEQGPPRLGKNRRIGGDGVPEVFCADEQSDVELDGERWAALAEATLAAEGVRGAAELSVMFVSEEAIAELNESFMGTPGPTDVLAFPIDGPNGMGMEVEVIAGPPGGGRGPDRPPIDLGDLPLLLGDVVVCPAVALRQAATHAGTVDDELALLIVHGVLHVLGYDHAEPEEAVAMRTRERELLEQLFWHGAAPAGFSQEHVE